MKVMILGVSGFLGHHITKEFQEQGYFVVGVDKRPVPKDHVQPDYFIQADVKDLIFRDLLGIDFVVSLFWRTNIPDCLRHPLESTYQNIDTTVHILEVAREAKIKKVFFPSTASLYGHNPVPWTEDMPPDPIDHYSWQKLSCESLCRMYAQTFGLNTAVARFFQIYGEFQREDTAIAAFLRAKQNGQPITLTETTAQSSFKSGQRDFIYAGDVAKAVVLLTCGKTEPGGIYNVGSGIIHSMEEIAEAIGGEIKWIPKREWEVETHLANIAKLKTFGWSPKVSVINWLKQYVKTM